MPCPLYRSFATIRAPCVKLLDPHHSCRQTCVGRKHMMNQSQGSRRDKGGQMARPQSYEDSRAARTDPGIMKRAVRKIFAGRATHPDVFLIQSLRQNREQYQPAPVATIARATQHHTVPCDCVVQVLANL